MPLLVQRRSRIALLPTGQVQSGSVSSSRAVQAIEVHPALKITVRKADGEQSHRFVVRGNGGVHHKTVGQAGSAPEDCSCCRRPSLSPLCPLSWLVTASQPFWFTSADRRAWPSLLGEGKDLLPTGVDKELPAAGIIDQSGAACGADHRICHGNGLIHKGLTAARIQPDGVGEQTRRSPSTTAKALEESPTK